MDKEWMHISYRVDAKYLEGARRFANMAQVNAGHPDKILCPCTRCLNAQHQHFDIVYEHLLINGMDPMYTIWYFHGENLNDTPQHESDKNDFEMLETYEMYRDVFFDGDNDNVSEPNYEKREAEFQKSLKYAETPLYPECTKYTIISSIVALYKHKAAHNLSDTGFEELLKLIGDMLPANNKLPKSCHATKKFLKKFDLGYEKIHAYKNDCCLFRKENEHMNTCPKCCASRWKENERTKKVQNNVPAKVLRYFPIIPRLRRMFRSREIAEQIMWHSTYRSQDKKMRHPVDTPAWDIINKKWPSFASDSRNLRLGLATDGFNPFGDLSSAYSCWPVILVVYNLPPLVLMSKENMMLTLLIPGPKQPGNDIDVYLEPLIDDLKELWDKGVEIYDTFSESKFNLKAILMWTISDFPAYSNLSGHVTKGKLACPTCSDDTCSRRLKSSTKHVYLGHRRFLPPAHPYRKKKSWFDGSEEHRWKPKILSGTEIFHTLEDFQNDWGKSKKRKDKKKKVGPWKKKSIFFELPYWEALLIRHNLDVMHIEKNVCESIISTLLNIKGKSKDGLNSRMDLKEMGIRGELHPKESRGKHYLPPAPHTLSKKEKQLFYKRLQQLKLPDGYSSNIGTRISLDECKVTGLKSHDYHVLMQQLLSVALRGILPKGPRNAIFRLCSYFNEVCQRVIDRNSLERHENEIAETLCMLERYFPPSFFDIMIHLTIHIAREARLCGPVQFCWMYPFERMMKVYKGYVRNRAKPEGCIAERYMSEECVQFCSDHIKQAAEIGVRHSRNTNFGGEIAVDGHPILNGISKIMSNDMLEIAHRYVLFNYAEVEPYIGRHLEELKHIDRRLIRNENALQKRHMETFSSWFADVISAAGSDVSDTLKFLANGPRREVVSHPGYVVNGQRFHTKYMVRSTQDSGVSVDAETICQSSARDTNQVVGKISYYGVIKDILLLDYYTFKVPIFDCEWANIRNGIKVEDGFVLVNLHEGQSQFQRDPFILASQAKQVFYSRDNETSNWYVALKAPPRGFNELESFEENSYMSSMPLDVPRLEHNDDDGDEHYVRVDCEGMTV